MAPGYFADHGHRPRVSMMAIRDIFGHFSSVHISDSFLVPIMH